MIKFKQKGDFKTLTNYLLKVNKGFDVGILDKYGEEGVTALRSATPKDTGLTADSWEYRVTRGDGSVSIMFNNTNVQNGVPIAIILQLGHGTNHGGWVEGRDYINPALRPVFEKIAEEAWEEVKRVG